MNKNLLEMLEHVTQVKRFDLTNGEPFAIVFKSDQMMPQDLQNIQNNLRSYYSKINHKIAIMCVGTDEDVDFFTLKELTERTTKS